MYTVGIEQNLPWSNPTRRSIYHRKCDRITNINLFAFEKVVQSVAYVLESIGGLSDLEKWLQSSRQIKCHRWSSIIITKHKSIYIYIYDPFF